MPKKYPSLETAIAEIGTLNSELWGMRQRVKALEGIVKLHHSTLLVMANGVLQSRSQLEKATRRIAVDLDKSITQQTRRKSASFSVSELTENERD